MASARFFTARTPLLLKDLAHLGDRVETYIDGLRIAGDTGWEICKQALALNEPGEVFAAAVLAFEGDDGQRVDEMVKVAIFWLGLHKLQSVAEI